MLSVKETKVKKNRAVELNRQEKAIFRLIGMTLIDRPDEIKKLLLQFGFELPKKPKRSELTDIIIQAILERNQAFNISLAEILANQKIPDNHDKFKKEDVASAAKATNVTVGADPVSAIAGAIGSIFSFAGNIANKKTLKEQARKESFLSMLKMQNENKKVIQKPKSIMEDKRIIIGVGIVSLITVGGLIFWNMKKKSKIQSLNVKPESQ